MPADLYERLAKRIRSRSVKIAVIGLGHVGLPLAVSFAEAGYQTIGVDNDKQRLECLARGKSYLRNKSVERSLPKLIRSGKLRVTTDTRGAVEEADCVEVCVPTPLDARNKPDTSIISDVLRTVGNHLKSGKLVIIESTVYPGFTESVARHLLQRKGLKCGKEFALACSPERLDPGNQRYELRDIPKIVGGVDETSAQLTSLLYERLLKNGVVQVSNARTAECTKLFENVYRFVNIALVNELALLCPKIGVDVFEVISAASSKPFGFHPHYPGPGVGGPCIPKDPYYLDYLAKKVGMPLRLVEASADINRMMPLKVVSQLRRELKALGLRSPKVAILGLAYKAGSSVTLNSPAIKVIPRLLHDRVKLRLYDPYVSSIRIDGKVMRTRASVTQASASADCLLFLVDHPDFKKLDLSNLNKVVAERCVLFDTRNIFDFKKVEAAGFQYLGFGKVSATAHAVR